MRTCKVCGGEYIPRTTLQRVCNIDCAIQELRDKQAKNQRKQDRAKRESLKTTTQLANEAQTAFNTYIRIRDENLPCISCGQSPYVGQRHASHYRSRAAASQLRFHTANTHASCAQCNSSKSGNIVEYRIRLIHKIGEDKVNWLENNQNVVKWEHDYLRRLKRIFNKRARHLRKLRDR